MWKKLDKKSYPHRLFIWIIFRIFKGGRAGIDWDSSRYLKRD